MNKENVHGKDADKEDEEEGTRERIKTYTASGFILKGY